MKYCRCKSNKKKNHAFSPTLREAKHWKNCSHCKTSGTKKSRTFERMQFYVKFFIRCTTQISLRHLTKLKNSTRKKKGATQRSNTMNRQIKIKRITIQKNGASCTKGIVIEKSKGFTFFQLCIFVCETYTCQ